MDCEKMPVIFRTLTNLAQFVVLVAVRGRGSRTLCGDT